MNTLIAVAVASTFALASVSAFAAGTMKLEDLTKEQRIDMRNRADNLIAERAANARPAVQHSPKVKKPYAAKS
jgi:hypothetical protein